MDIPIVGLASVSHVGCAVSSSDLPIFLDAPGEIVGYMVLHTIECATENLRGCIRPRIKLANKQVWVPAATKLASRIKMIGVATLILICKLSRNCGVSNQVGLNSVKILCCL